MRTVLSAIAAASLLLTGGTASAATVHGNLSAEEVTYRASPGEANALTFQYSEELDIVVRDPGATIVATGACVSRDAHTAVCPYAEIVNVTLGDLNDSVGDPEESPYGDVRGGEGDDTLRWSSVGSLYGGPGNDTLTVTSLGSDDTVMYGGPGADVFRAPRDVLSVVSYATERAGVRVTLDGVANDGAPGERDNVTRAIHFVVGSDGADVLIGNEGMQWLYGLEGNDRLVGRGARDVFFGDAGNDVSIGGPGNDAFRDFGGNDRLFGGPGPDAISAHSGADLLVGGPGRDGLNGGPGPDRIFARDGARDHVFGGDGFDRAQIDRRDRVGLVERVL